MCPMTYMELLITETIVVIGPKNTDHSFSYILHYLKTCGKVPHWVQRVHVFMDNAGSTNKNEFMMAATIEVVQQNILNYFRISCMVAGHTKFAPDTARKVLVLKLCTTWFTQVFQAVSKSEH